MAAHSSGKGGLVARYNSVTGENKVIGSRLLGICGRGKKPSIRKNFVYGWQKLHINFDHVWRAAFSRKF